MRKRRLLAGLNFLGDPPDFICLHSYLIQAANFLVFIHIRCLCTLYIVLCFFLLFCVVFCVVLCCVASYCAVLCCTDIGKSMFMLLLYSPSRKKKPHLYMFGHINVCNLDESQIIMFGHIILYRLICPKFDCYSF